jgi:hypothetical protein
MTPEKLDLIFPFLVFGYGAVMTLILHHPFFVAMADQRLPISVVTQIRGHRVLGLICLGVGAVWSTQNLWL